MRIHPRLWNAMKLLSASTLFQMGGCAVDPDIILRSSLSLASDLSVFFLENLVRSL